MAWNYPSSTFSQIVLDTLVPQRGRPEQLHLSISGAIGSILILTGMVLRLTTYRYLGKFFKYEASIQKDHKLITSGPYALVRHPSYAALIISHLGWVLWNGGDGSWFRALRWWDTLVGKCVFLTYFFGVLCGELYLVLARMKNEDEALRKCFKDQWEEWARTVPYSVVPGVY